MYRSHDHAYVMPVAHDVGVINVNMTQLVMGVLGRNNYVIHKIEEEF